MADVMQTDVKFVKGVGPVRAKMLEAELGVRTVRDLLYTFPYKHIDRSVIHHVADLQEGMPYVQLRGRIAEKNIEGSGRKERLVATFADETGWVELVWFNSVKHIERTLKVGGLYLLLGKPAYWNGRMNIAHPELEEVDPSKPAVEGRRMMPFYHTTERMKRQGFTSRLVGELVERAFAMLEGAGQRAAEVLPPYLTARYNLMPLDGALRIVHRPQRADELPEAERRMKFEELFFLQLDILRYANRRKRRGTGFVMARVGSMFLRFFHERLPFELTGAQKRVVKEVRADLLSGWQMNRLLQGDVGSGKTMVALLCCLLAVDNGFQSCIMAPTEILAEQHYASLTQLLGDLPVKVELLTGAVKGKRRKEVLAGVADGSVHILVGTHALIEPSVVFLNIGLAVVDEQHRFGVEQRARLWQKNARPPHVLVMTATPIPRTLAMTVYGDLDVSVIDELPPGRKPIRTIHYGPADRSRLMDGVRYQLGLGRQVYVVYPLIKGSEKQQLHDLMTGYAQMVDALPQYKVGMVHGQMKSADKDEAMRRFKEGETQVLVATTVIEVGVNVPNASVMVIENADRFGLAQLHQLRGRVGRGAEQSFCILMTGARLSDTTRRRMQVMTESTDGFVIAEEDMRLRGPGDIEGTAQSGMPFDLKIANLTKDQEILQVAREAAQEVLDNDPGECLPQNAVMWRHLQMLKKTVINFSAIS